MICKRIIALLIIVNNQFFFAAEINTPNEITYLGIPFVQLPISVNPDEAILKLLNGDVPIASNIKKAKITPGFGTKFDYSTTLRQGEGKNEGVYKKRLKFLRMMLQSFIDASLIHDDSIKTHNIQALPQLKGFTLAWQIYKLSSKSRFADALVINGFVPSIRSTDDITNTSEGTIIKFNNNNLYYLTEPDAQSIMFMIKKIKSKKTKQSPSEFKNFMTRLINTKDLSDQAKRIIYFLINDKYMTGPYLNLYVENTRELILKNAIKSASLQELISQNTDEDKKKILGLKSNLPHYNDICVLLAKYIEYLSAEQSLCLRAKNIMYFNKNLEDIFIKFQKYIPILDALQNEYVTIYERVNDELRSKKKHHTATKTKKPKSKSSTTLEQSAPDQPMMAEPVFEPVKELPKIRYDKRVKRWFRNSFTKFQPPSKIRYHTLLPLACDPIVVAFGAHTLRPNATRKGQRDDNYRIAGEVTENDKKDFYIFELCLDPKGICYHRGCKKTNYEAIESELGKIDAIDSDDLNDQVDVEAIDDQRAKIIKDAELYTQAYNPDCQCKITLYKQK